jgi:hypothetical protein
MDVLRFSTAACRRECSPVYDYDAYDDDDDGDDDDDNDDEDNDDSRVADPHHSPPNDSCFVVFYHSQYQSLLHRHLLY